MVTGRLLFGIGSETLAVAVLVALAQWFTGRHFALLFALNTEPGAPRLLPGRSLAVLRGRAV